MNKPALTALTLLCFMFCATVVIAQHLVNDHPVLRMPNVENAYPRLSADGKQILFQSSRSGNWQLYVMDIATGKQHRLTNDNYNNNLPDWNTDNSVIAFVSDRDGNEEIYLMDNAGKNLRRITNSGGRDIHPYFSPDGRYLLFNSTRANKSLDIFRYTLSDGTIEQLTNTPTDDETCARYNSRMNQIVFLRNSESEDDIYIMAMATGAETNLTRTPAIRDGWPVFSKDDQWIYYSSMLQGTFGIYRMKPDGSKKQQLSFPEAEEEDARVFIASDNHSLVYNKRTGKTMEIRSVVVN
jgi:Tol biopolymer transport system component